MFYRLAVFFFVSFSLFAVENDYRVLGVGSAPIDLLIQVDDSFLAAHIWGEKGGSCPCDPTTIERVIRESGKKAKYIPGGSAANTIRALAKLGEKCAFFSHVGNDVYGEAFCCDIAASGIVSRIVEIAESSTAHVLCMVSPEGERTFLGYDPVVEEQLPADEDLDGVQWIHMEARQFDHSATAMKTLKMARERGIKTSIDLSCPEIVRKHKEILLEALAQYIDIVFCNENEVQVLTGLSPEEGCLKLQELCPVAVVTLGSKGCLVGYGKKAVLVPALPANVIDTTGAGDFFAAGFLYGYLQAKSMEVCALIGHRLGSAVVQEIGAQISESKWEEIRLLTSRD